MSRNRLAVDNYRSTHTTQYWFGETRIIKSSQIWHTRITHKVTETEWREDALSKKSNFIGNKRKNKLIFLIKLFRNCLQIEQELKCTIQEIKYWNINHQGKDIKDILTTNEWVCLHCRSLVLSNLHFLREC